MAATPDDPDRGFDGGAAGAARLPAARLDAAGRLRIDSVRVLALALPLFLNSGIQAVLNLTDTWYVGRISTTAVAAVGAVHWVILGLIVLLGGVGMAVQAYAAQAFGAGRRRRASAYAWNGIWASLCLAPVFVGLAALGPFALPLLGLDASLTRYAIDFWEPRMGGAFLGLVLWSMQSFFNGVSRVRTTLAINLVVALANAALNDLLILRLGYGIAGSGWATCAAQLVGVLIGLYLMLATAPIRDGYRAHLTWRPRWRLVASMVGVGLGIGAMVAFDILGMAVFQIMMTRLGIIDGAATQIVMMLTSVAFMPAVGLGMAGTTLVGQSIGAGDRAWAYRVGNRVILMAAGYMGAVGLVLALAGPWLLPWFVGAAGEDAAPLVALGERLLWVAACYQIFDGLQLGSGFCLRGAGDTRFPALIFLVLAWGVFLPLAHLLTFAPGEGLVPGLPGLGAGSYGGWWGAVVYVGLLAIALVWRWRSRRWMSMRLA